MIPSVNKTQKYAFFLLVVILPFLFTDFNFMDRRLVRLFMDTGHIPLFILIGVVLQGFFRPLKSRVKAQPTIIPLLLLILLPAFSLLLIAALIEVGQSFVGRNADLVDVRKDMLGSCIFLYVWLWSFFRSQLLRFSAGLILICWLAFEVLPFSSALMDRVRIHRDFPVLADFENKAEMSRWGEGLARRVDSKSKHVKAEGLSGHVMKLYLNTDSFSGIVGEGLNRNWLGYKTLAFDFYNPNPYVLILHVKVEDHQTMLSGYKFSDRYNGIYIMRPGLNNYTVSLDKVAEAPENRRMNFENTRLSFFFANLSKKTFVYLDNVRLLD